MLQHQYSIAKEATSKKNQNLGIVTLINLTALICFNHFNSTELGKF